MCGLSELDISCIKNILASFPAVEEAILFGSRAKKTHAKGSDVDLALKGKELNRVVSEIGGILNEESPLPYFFDILNYQTITSDALRDQIDRVGVVLYRAKEC